MITVILSGGLGNQMFEYAAGRALSLRLKAKLSTDTYILTKRTKATRRNYELAIFNIDTPISNSIINKIAIKLFGIIRSRKTGYLILSKLGIFRDEKAQYYDSRF